MLRFTPTQRLVNKTAFDVIYREGRRRVDPFFLVLTRNNTLGHARLGLAVSARTVGCAVNRNRIKRVVRESFRLNQAHLPSVDIVVSTRQAARTASNVVLTEKLQQCWQALAKQNIK